MTQKRTVPLWAVLLVIFLMVIGFGCKYAEYYTPFYLESLTASSGEQAMAALRRWSGVTAAARPLPMLCFTAALIAAALFAAAGRVSLRRAAALAGAMTAGYALSVLPFLWMGGAQALPASAVLRTLPWMLVRGAWVLCGAFWLGRRLSRMQAPRAGRAWLFGCAAVLAVLFVLGFSGVLTRALALLIGEGQSAALFVAGYRDATRLTLVFRSGAALPYLVLSALCLIPAAQAALGRLTLPRAAAHMGVLLLVQLAASLVFARSFAPPQDALISSAAAHLALSVLLSACTAGWMLLLAQRVRRARS